MSETEDDERLRIELAVRKSEERFRQVVESAPSAMVMVGRGGRIEMVNAQAEKLFGYGREELLGQSIEMLVPHRFRSNHPQLRVSFFSNPAARPMGAGRDLFGLKKDGSEFPIEIGLNPIETDEGTMVLSAIVDISDRKQKEERIESALSEKDILLGEIHHRVKNNPQVVNSLLDLQIDRIQDDLVLDILRESQNRIKSMALIHQSLYESKDFGQVDFGIFLDSIAPTLVSSYGIDAGRITLDIDAVEVQLPIHAAVPYGLVTNELISNALKHGFPDGRRGEIKINFSREPDGIAALSISDNGKGLPDSLGLAKTEMLGLQLVHLLTDQLGGTLTINRTDPTTFVLRFPIQRSP